MFTRSKMKNSKENLLSATSLVNYIRNDGIIDYFEIVSKNNYIIDTDDDFKLKKRKYSEMTSPKINYSNNLNQKSDSKRKTSFDYIVENGYIFEDMIFNQIKEKMKTNNDLNKLIEIDNQDFNMRFNKTCEILSNKKHDVIMGGLLINKLNNTYGYPDLIVSGKWIKKYIEDSPSVVSEKPTQYYIIDVKSSSINLINGGKNVSSGLLFDGYKSQIFVYTQALNSILNTEISLGFILGKKYSFTLNKSKVIISNPFGKLGIIDYDYEKANGIDFSKQISDAIQWKTQLKKQWQDMHLSPIDNDNLYPNMKNHYDKNYKKIKKDVAYENKEITLLWNCGIKNRKTAWDNGIKKFTDEKLTPELLGISNKNSRYDIIDKMLFINKQNNLNVILSKNNNYMDWQSPYENEFFVDFETYSKEKIFDENSNDFFENLALQIIYMIGVIYTNPQTNLKEFKCFISNFNNCSKTKTFIKNEHKCKIDSYIYCDGENDLIQKFTKFILGFKKHNDTTEDYFKKTRLVHWSQAEPIIFNKKIKELGLQNTKIDYNLPWYDLLRVFKYDKEPIIIKDCFSFGLKDIIKNLNAHGMVGLEWPELDDGLLSSFIAKDIYLSKNKYTNKEVENMINIVEYNYIDCLALDKLIVWMRNYVR